MLARLVKSFNWRHQPRRHAVDLVAAVHVVLRMLHHLNSSGMQRPDPTQCRPLPHPAKPSYFVLSLSGHHIVVLRSGTVSQSG